jgi:hypothetical protein
MTLTMPATGLGHADRSDHVVATRALPGASFVWRRSSTTSAEFPTLELAFNLSAGHPT